MSFYLAIFFDTPDSPKDIPQLSDPGETESEDNFLERWMTLCVATTVVFLDVAAAILLARHHPVWNNAAEGNEDCPNAHSQVCVGLARGE